MNETQRLVARGGPDAVRAAGRLSLHYEPEGAWWYTPPAADEVFFPVAAVLAALPSPSLQTLQDDWNEALWRDGPLPVYLHETVEGHYTAMMAESFILKHLIALIDTRDAAMQEGDPDV
jgi:hypothetical protein